MTMSPTATKRLDVRLRPEHRRLLERAALVSGQSLSAFTISTLVHRAEEVLARSSNIRLTDQDRDIFLNALDHPPAPNKHLKEAARLHRKMVRQ
jgi:uncharacterized protein (DUF1778 family)